MLRLLLVAFILPHSNCFRRDSVESLPLSMPQRIFQPTQKFGSTYLPLRSAVEKVATTRERAQEHFPLREAVEKRPPPPSRVGPWWRVKPLTKQSPSGIDIKGYNTGKIFCFVESWASYRRSPATFTADDIDPFSCTHIIYSFANVDPINSKITPQDEEYDIVKGGYRSIVGLKRKNSNLKILLSVTGRLSKMTSTATNRRNFILSAVKMLAEHGFDGIDLHWEHPGAEDLGGNRNDKDNYAVLIEELSGVLESRGWILTASVTPSRFRLHDGYDVPRIAPYLHYILLKSYDFHTERDSAANHPSPLRVSFDEDPLSVYYNVDYAVRFWLSRGAHRGQLILGIPFFGRSYTLEDPEKWTPGSAIKSYGKEGSYTQQPGFLAYYEICDKLKSKNWTKHNDKGGSAYIVNGDQWIGYEDEDSIRDKVQYLKQYGLGGVMLWSLDLDDFKGHCGNKYPLLNAVRSSLVPNLPAILPSGVGVTLVTSESNCTGEGYLGQNDCSVYYRCNWPLKQTFICPHGFEYDYNIGICNWPSLVTCPKRVAQPENSNTSPKVKEKLNSASVRTRNRKMGPKVVCYFTNWSWYRKGDGKFFPEHMNPSLCTHIIYAFATLEPNSLTIASFDPWADIDNNMYKRVTSIQKAGTEVLLAIGGWTDSAGDKYSKLVSSGSSRRSFVSSVIAFLRRHGFDGLSLDWNYPVCWHANCKKGPESDKSNFVKLLQELREAFDKESPPLTLAVAISGYQEIIEAGYDLRSISRVVDIINVMTFDYHGAWEGVTGHVSPLHGSPNDNPIHYNVESTVKLILSNGAEKEKLVIAVPFYGQTFTLKSKSETQMGSSVSGPGHAGKFTLQPGMMAYYEICEKIKKQNWRKQTDPSGPYAYFGDQLVTFDDPASIKEKGEFVKTNGLGGLMAWTLDLDDFHNTCCEGQFPLLIEINRVLGREVRETVSGCEKPPEPVTPPPPPTTLAPDDGSGTSTTEHQHEHWTEGTTSPTTSKPWWTPESTTSEKPTTTKPWWTPESTTSEKPTTTTTKQTTTTKTTTTQKTTTETSYPSEEIPEIPASCNTGEHKAALGDCNAYYRCILGEFVKQKCAGGLHWNDKKQICDWPGEANCKSDNIQSSTTTEEPFNQWEPSSTTTPTTTTEYTSTTRQPQIVQHPPAIVNCKNGKYYPVPGKCNSFYMCVNGVLVEQTCAPGLSWNIDQKICDWSFSVRCNTEDRFNLQLRANECSRGIFSPYPNNCNKYLQCQWEKYEINACPPGLHWNQEMKICDWPSNAGCKTESGSGEEDLLSKPEPERPHNEITTTTKPTTTTQWTWKPENEWSWTTSTTTEEPWPDTPYDHPLSGYFKVVCYFTNWAWYRQGKAKYLPEDIKSDLCTHIVYGFAVLDFENLILKAHDSWADFDNHFYERVVKLRRKGVKVSLALGGWNDSQGDKYSRLVNNPAARQKFIAHVVPLLKKHKFDGLDLDWEYPKCWQTNCNQGKDSDKEAFGMWVRELRAEFNKHNLLLSAAVTPSKTIIDAGYDIPALAESLDWVAVMTYDYHGQWDKKTGHVAPMYEHPEDDFNYFNANYSINYWIDGGIPRRKIVMGMPMYGQGFTLADPKNHGLNAPAPGPSQAGEFTRAAGFLAYYEICDKIKNHGWTVVKDEENRIGPYAYQGNQWVGFDDKEMIKLKSEYIRKMDLGGGMIWALDLDDFRNTCGEGEHPLLSIIADTLATPPSSGDHRPTMKPTKPTTKPTNPTTKPTNPTKKPKPGGTKPAVKPPMNEPVDSAQKPDISSPVQPDSENVGQTTMDSNFKVVCYFTNWAWYRQGTGKYLPSDIDPNLCTHVVYGFAVLDTDKLRIKPHDTWADFDNKFYEKVTALKKKGIKVTIAIGGWNDSAGNKYSRLVNNPSARAGFNSHVLEFILENNFDGLDLDWEYPKCWQVDCKQGPDSDKQAFADWIRELRAIFKPHGLLLSAAVSPSKAVIDAGYDVPTMSENLDWIAVMTYDYHGQWDKRTGHVAPMYAHDEDIDVTFNANFTLNYWVQKGADRRKLVMGMPMYGQSFSLADNSNNGLNAPTYGGGEAGEETRARGFLSYYEICDRVLKRGWELVIDESGAMGPYARTKDQWVGFDDAAMIKHKSEYVKMNNYGGAMIWALDLDDFRNTCGCEEYPLLRTINRVLRNYPPGPLCSLSKGLKSPSVTTVSESDLRDHCPDIAGDKTDCTKFYTCQHGKLLRNDCPPGLHFNSNKKMCDWPENAKCKSGDGEVGVENEITPPGADTDNVPDSIPVSEPEDLPTIVDSSSGYKVVCYFTNWAWYRQGKGKYRPEDIDTSLCTHIVYAFAVLDSERLEIKSHDSWADIDNSFYSKVASLAKKGIKVLLGLGGWNDSLGDKYSRLVNNPNARRNFVRQAVQFVEKYDFQGLDLDWEYPKCWQVDCNKGPDSDKEGFANLVRELSAEFKPRGWLLSAAVSPSKVVIDQAYDVPTMAKYLDWIALMAYDYHGHWEGRTGHVAPLYYNEGDTYSYFNGNFSVHYWIDHGTPNNKLVLGMPLYGQSFTLANASDTGLNSITTGPGTAGQFTRAAGFLAYYEICETISGQNWKVVRNKNGNIGPIAYNGNQWISYDDVEDIRRKSKFIKENNLGGGMVWALDLDDFQNICGCGKSPLLSTINQELRNRNGNTNNCT